MKRIRRSLQFGDSTVAHTANDDQPVIKLAKLSDSEISTMKEEIKASPEVQTSYEKPLTRTRPSSVTAKHHNGEAVHDEPGQIDTRETAEATDPVLHMDIKMLSNREISSLKSSLKRSHSGASKRTGTAAAGGGDKSRASPKERTKSEPKMTPTVDGDSPPKRTEWNCPLCKAQFANTSLLGAHLNKQHLTTKEPVCPLCHAPFNTFAKICSHIISVHTD